MIKRTSLFALALCFAALAACGGNVVIDDSVGGNGTGGSNGGATGGTTSTTTTSTGPFDPLTFCTKVCTDGNQYGCLSGSSISECAKGCVQVFDQYKQCQAEITALYQCFDDQLPKVGCNSSDACNVQAQAFTTCAGGGGAGGGTTCGTDACGGDGNGCFCTGQCANADLEADCKSAPDGTVECACYVNGGVVGTCNDVDLSCDLFNGCCASYFPL